MDTGWQYLGYSDNGTGWQWMVSSVWNKMSITGIFILFKLWEIMLRICPQLIILYTFFPKLALSNFRAIFTCFLVHTCSGHLFQKQNHGQCIKAVLASATQESIPASELLHHSEVTIFFPLPLKLFVAHTTKLCPTVQHKRRAIEWEGKRIFTHNESLELKNKSIKHKKQS